jgi:hypothetical protein
MNELHITYRRERGKERKLRCENLKIRKTKQQHKRKQQKGYKTTINCGAKTQPDL